MLKHFDSGNNIQGAAKLNNMASMDCLIMPQPSGQVSLDMSQVMQNPNDSSINEDLRNFAKSSTNLAGID